MAPAVWKARCSPEIQYAYDAAGNLESETDPDGNTTSYTYDALGRELSQADELGDTTYYVYDGDGNVSQSTDPDGQVIQYTYNDLNQLTEQDWFDSSDTQTNSIAYTYDNLGDMLTATDTYPSADASQDSAYAFTYNVLGQQTSVDNLGGESGGTAGVPDVVLASSYDALGNRTSLDATIGGTNDFQNAYSYDGFGRESQVTQSGVEGGNAVADKLVTFSYNADNQYSEIDTYAGLTTDSTLVTTSIYGYDSIGRLTSLDEGNSTSSTEYAGYSWTYNADSLVSTAGNSVYSAEDVAYSYDHDSQLIGATYSGDSSLNQTFSYDANGNQSGTGITLNNTGGTETGNNQITDDGTWTYTYDADGNLTKQVGDSGHSEAGNEIDYTYDVGGRLVEVKNLTDDVVTQDVQYTYDMFGDLIGRKLTLYSDGEPSSTTTSRFAYDVANGQMVLAFDGSGNLTDRFLNGPAVDQILADENYSSPTASPSAAGNTLWMLTDNQGTVRDIVDSSGTDVDHLTYDSFGKLTGGALYFGATDVIFAGYTGSFYDSATGLVHDGTRWYSPNLQRWPTPDPSGLGPDSNPYRYVENDPGNFDDPWGEQAATGGSYPWQNQPPPQSSSPGAPVFSPLPPFPNNNQSNPSSPPTFSPFPPFSNNQTQPSPFKPLTPQKRQMLNQLIHGGLIMVTPDTPFILLNNSTQQPWITRPTLGPVAAQMPKSATPLNIFYFDPHNKRWMVMPRGQINLYFWQRGWSKQPNDPLPTPPETPNHWK